jgi:hypothetical protein
VVLAGLRKAVISHDGETSTAVSRGLLGAGRRILSTRLIVLQRPFRGISLDFAGAPPDVVSARLTGPATIAIVLPTTGVAQLRLDLTSDDGSHTAVLQLPSLPDAPALRWLGGVEDDLSPPAGLTREYWITARPVSAEFPGGEIRVSAADYWSPA